MQSKGYIKIHREIIDHPVFKNALVFRLFIAILLLSDRKTGTIATSYAQLGKVVGVNERIHVKELLQKLVGLGSISLEVDTNKKNSSPVFIRVINFDKWQLGVSPQDTGCIATGYTGVSPQDTQVYRQRLQGVTPQDTGCIATGNTPLPFKQEIKQEDKQEWNIRDEKSNMFPRVHAEIGEPIPSQSFNIPSFDGMTVQVYPSSVNDVINAAAFQCIDMSDKEANAFIDKYAAVGWMDKNGNRIVKWHALLRSWHDWWKYNEEKRRQEYVRLNPDAAKPGFGDLSSLSEEELERIRHFK